MYPRNKIKTSEVKKFIYIFYLVGLVGFLIPFSRDLFIAITPLALLLNIYLLAAFHTNFTTKNSLIFVLIFTLGYFIEVLGVRTSLIFGEYQYDIGLGIKFLDTPLLIGANWLFLTYVSTSIIDQLKVKRIIAIILSPSLMLMYDMVLEQVAPHIRMWHWTNEHVPVQNYLAWYAIALAMVILLKFSKVNTKNSLAKSLFIAQFMFFFILMLFFNL